MCDFTVYHPYLCLCVPTNVSGVSSPRFTAAAVAVECGGGNGVGDVRVFRGPY